MIYINLQLLVCREVECSTNIIEYTRSYILDSDSYLLFSSYNYMF